MPGRQTRSSKRKRPTEDIDAASQECGTVSAKVKKARISSDGEGEVAAESGTISTISDGDKVGALQGGTDKVAIEQVSSKLSEEGANGTIQGEQENLKDEHKSREAIIVENLAIVSDQERDSANDGKPEPDEATGTDNDKKSEEDVAENGNDDVGSIKISGDAEASSSESPLKKLKSAEVGKTDKAEKGANAKEDDKETEVKAKVEEKESRKDHGGFTGFSGFTRSKHMTSFASLASTDDASGGFGSGGGFDGSKAAVAAFDATNGSDEVGTTESGSEKATMFGIGEYGPLQETAAPASSLVSGDYEALNGEEGEVKVYQVRAKLWKRDTDEWHELGKGPLRVLDPMRTVKDAGPPRLVMRRESHANGPGTKVIFNVNLEAGVTVDYKEDEKHFIRLGCVEKDGGNVKSSLYLVRVLEPIPTDAEIKARKLEMSISKRLWQPASTS